MMRWAFYTPIVGPKTRLKAAPALALCKNRSMSQAISFLVVAFLIVAPHSAGAQSKMYKWTDENGVVHYGDHVPASHVKSRAEVLNSQGVTVNVIEGQKTADDLAEEIRLRGLEQERLAAETARRAYDRALIDSYASVDDILATRKRRLDAVDGQIIFTTHHIGRMKNRIVYIEEEILRVTGGKRKVPERLADELAGAMALLEEHKANLEAHYLDQARIRIKYAEDIERYKVLRGMAKEKLAEAAAEATDSE